jgi:putative nucleotidyltransferase with HDIG domain
MSGGPDGPVPQRSLASLRAATDGPRNELAKVIPRRPRVSWWLGVLFALGFAFVVTPTLTADRWMAALGAGVIKDKQVASLTIRVPAISGYTTPDGGHIGNGGVLIARGEEANADDEHNAARIQEAAPRGALPYVALFLLTLVLAAIFTHHMRRSTRGRLVRVQIVSLVAIAILAIAVKVMLLMTSLSVLIVPVALFAMIPTLALDRVVGLATGILGALTVALLGPFDVGVAIILLVQAAVAGLVVAEQPKDRFRAVLTAGAVTTLFTAATYVLLTYLTTGRLPALRDPLHAAWFAAAVGPAIATVLAVPLLPLYQMLVGEITRGKLIELEDLSNPLLRQIAQKAPGTWQHSLMMANMAEIAANAIGANGRFVRVGAYYHDLGKSLQPKYFIENLDPGETSPHDQLPPEVSCDAIFAHVTEGIVAARKAGLHERIVDFMHMHHGNGVLEYFWGKTKEIGNPRGLSIEQFRYPGHPPQSRETAILAICDAVEAASRTLKKPDAQSIDSLVQRIVYGKLHLGQLDESGLSMSDLRRISDSLKETIRHANHGRIEYPWQKAQQDASASKDAEPLVQTNPRLDSLDRSPAQRDTSVKSGPASASISGQTTAEVGLAETKPVKPEKKDVVDPILATAPVSRVTKPGTVPPPVPERSKPPSSPPIELVQRRTPTKPPPVKADEVALADIAKSVRKGPTQPPPDGIITSATFGEAAPAARKRAATLPPTLIRRAPTVPPPAAPGRRSSPTIPPIPGLEHRTAGPPSPVDLENAVTNPPPLRMGSPISRLPPFIVEERPTATPHEDVTMPAMKLEPRDLFDRAATDDESRRTMPNIPSPDDAASTAPSFPRIEEAARTEPSMPRFELPIAAPPPSFPGVIPPPPPAKLKTPGLAQRIDAKLDGDEWSTETPIKAPTAAELRALLGQPDVTKQQSIAELERLSAESRAREQAEEDARPEILSRRHPMPTSEVDEDDIEAAMEVLPPARRPNAIAVAKQKKSE